MVLRDLFNLLKTAVLDWFADGAPSMGAAIAFYALFSLAPVLVLMIAAAGLVFGQRAARGELFARLSDLMGARGAAAVEDLLRSVSSPGSGILATVIGIVMLLIAATAMFTELRYALNRIWRLERASHSPLWSLILARLVGLLAILAIGLLFLMSLLANVALGALAGEFRDLVPQLPRVLRVVDLGLTFLLTAIACLALFTLLPDARPGWRAIGLGAVAAALLFTIGKYLFSLYIGSAHMTSAYGAAGGIVILLMWVYYSAQILLFGAELAKAYGGWERRRHPPRLAS